MSDIASVSTCKALRSTILTLPVDSAGLLWFLATHRLEVQKDPAGGKTRSCDECV